MKRLLGVLVIVALTTTAIHALAAGQGKGAPRTTTVKGEIVDMGCYLGHGARGAEHKSCAARCLAGGMPIGLLTPGNKLYLLTLNHDNPDAYNKCKELAAENVAVTGALAERNGIMAIDVTEVRTAK